MGPPEKASPTPEQLGGRAGNRAGETDHFALMGEDGQRRLWRYGTAKAATLRTMDAVGHSAAKQAGIRVANVLTCGDWLAFRHFPTLGETRLQSAKFCSTHLVCGFCAIRRGARMMSRYLERFNWIRAKHPDLVPYLVTFTVRNGDDLRERLNHLEKALTRLHKRRYSKRSRSLLTEVDGAVWSYEVTYSEQHGWHPHVHAVYLAKEIPSEAQLRKEWEEITVDSFMCDVRPITPDPNVEPGMDPYAYGFAEVFKYALKAAELPAHRLLESFGVLRGRRLVRSFGHFFGVKEPDNGDLADEMPDADLPYIDLLWRYSGGRYEFAKAYERRDVVDTATDETHVASGDCGVSDERAGELGTGRDRPMVHERGHGTKSRNEVVFRHLRDALRLQASGGPEPHPA